MYSVSPSRQWFRAFPSASAQIGARHFTVPGRIDFVAQRLGEFFRENPVVSGCQCRRVQSVDDGILLRDVVSGDSDDVDLGISWANRASTGISSRQGGQFIDQKFTSIGLPKVSADRRHASGHELP
ncbi:MAG: hypothetical protein U1F34_02145 [Gammaproteobacteria bacterium]